MCFRYLRSVDKYNEWLVSAFVAPNGRSGIMYAARETDLCLDANSEIGTLA